MGTATAATFRDRGALLALVCIVPIFATLVFAVASDALRPAMLAALPLLGRYAAVLVLPPLVAWLVARTMRWRISSASLALFGHMVAFALFAGLAQAAALALLLAAAIVVGSALSGRANRPMAPSALATAALAGIGVIVGIAGWLLPLPIHKPLVYLLVSGWIVLAGRSRLHAALRDGAAAWRGAVAAQPAAAFLAVSVAGLAAILTWLPSLNPDDNAVHLLLAKQLLVDSYYRIDVSTQVFAVAPWFNDLLHGVLSLLSGAESRSAAGLAWLLFGCAGAYRLAGLLGARGAYPWLAATLYASHPLTAYFGMTLQVDAASAACLLHIAACCVEFAEEPEATVSPWTIGVLCGVIAALKVTNCVYLALLGGWLVWRHARTGRWRALLLLLATAAVIAGSSYCYAWVITGNPIFPLYNGLFKSPYMAAVDFGDPRWHSGWHPGLLWSLTFSSGDYMEAYAGAAGLSLLALAGAWLVGLVSGGWRAALLLVALVGGAVVFYQVQYLRYIVPALGLLGTVAVVAVGSTPFRRTGIVALVALVLVQCSLVRTTSWILASGVAEQMLAQGPVSLRDIERRFVPERELVRQLGAEDREFCLLFADPVTAYVALAPGRSLTTAFYDPRMRAVAEWASNDPTGARWQAALDRVGVTAVEMRPAQAAPGLAKALSALGFSLAGQRGEAQLWSRDGLAARGCLGGVMAPRDEARRLFRLR
jgi:4-amino-4-deoxy-L-arabinose transferase-like glycosyltransferase